MKKKTKKLLKIRMIALAVLLLVVLITGALFSFMAFKKDSIASGVTSIVISLLILVFGIFVVLRNNEELKKGLPIHDERSRKVMEKASSKAFYVSLYLLLLVGFLSDNIISFRDVSQATSITVGGMALLFAGFWVYYNHKEL